MRHAGNQVPKNSLWSSRRVDRVRGVPSYWRGNGKLCSMKRLTDVIIAAAAALLLSACQRSTTDTLRIGVVAELTGDMPAVGASCRDAAQLSADEINAAGGLQVGEKRYQVELLVEDNGGRAEQSVSAAQKLITQDEVLAMVGPNASRYAIPVSEIAESAGVPMITPWSTNPQATLNARSGQPKKYVFRACFIDPFQGRVVAKFAKEQLKTKRAAVLYDVASDYNKGIAEFFRKTFEEEGGVITSFETYTTNDKDFSAQLTKIKESAPELVFLPNYYSEVPLQIQQAKRLGLNVPFLGSDSWGSADLIKLCGADCEGYYFSTHYAADSAAPTAVQFISNYRAKYGKAPDDVAALTYDAFGLLWQALQRSERPEREALRNALANLSNYEGVTGTMRFQTGSGDPIKSAVIVKIKEGKFVWFANAQP
jgi:branched-chain amino acid transport system substrate-binding protein